jgi:hypothetical protein
MFGVMVNGQWVGDSSRYGVALLAVRGIPMVTDDDRGLSEFYPSLRGLALSHGGVNRGGGRESQTLLSTNSAIAASECHSRQKDIEPKARISLSHFRSRLANVF